MTHGGVYSFYLPARSYIGLNNINLKHVEFSRHFVDIVLHSGTDQQK